MAAQAAVAAAAAGSKGKKKKKERGIGIEKEKEFWSAKLYGRDLPSEGDVIIVRIKSGGSYDMGLLVSMLEFGYRDAFMNLGDMSRRTVSSRSARLLRKGRIMVCKVVKVDVQRGNTDISRRALTFEQVAHQEEFFKKAKLVHSLMWGLARKHDLPTEEVCKKISWPLFAKGVDAFDAIHQHVKKEADLWQLVDLSKPGKDLTSYREAFEATFPDLLEKRLKQRYLKLRATIEVWCEEEVGIGAVQDAIRAGMAAQQTLCRLKIGLIRHPIFFIDVFCYERSVGISLIDDCISRIGMCINGYGGQFRLRTHPDRGRMDDFEADLDSCFDEEDEDLYLMQEEGEEEEEDGEAGDVAAETGSTAAPSQ
mmetsp:Transcript_64129/g.134832  ORF Transcript_64129/g.134832 Transcript_64129/m.134832 type:complete len:366 (-) Transcript_64129:402-1499(-)|eukprot:CAMPEP_0206424376 /NCGR_PEP_ID=MMETSP0324_2-20121206/3193_1 /ASSEMBLY_ACC=CAM_ASM_000836 /TAXON_ID=2866 /ORGANISM="Crypthecodinium cohnii, Strain Seligo" /LENGTH=365 /DNA_ID=CAMNT_0053889023 /DNA_START=176 /DNA_END=1273 /DNA_ORIENTATION=-